MTCPGWEYHLEDMRHHPYDHTLLKLYTERLSVIVRDCPVQMQQKIFSEIFSAKISICLTPPHSFTSATIQNQAKAFLAMQVVIDSSRQLGRASWSCNQLLLIPQTHSPGCQAACFFVKPYTMFLGDLKDITIFTLPCLRREWVLYKKVFEMKLQIYKTYGSLTCWWPKLYSRQFHYPPWVV